jgi:Pectate lyase superfamily protein
MFSRVSLKSAIVGMSLVASAVVASAPAIACGMPYMIDVKCYGAAGNGQADDAAAIDVASREAIRTGQPLLLPPGTYRVGHTITIDYVRAANTGFRLISMGARIDGTGISSGPVLRVSCSGGSPERSIGCFYFKEEGTLFVDGRTNDYAVEIGNSDFSDTHNSIKIDHLISNNAGEGGAVKFNYVLNADLFVVGDTAGSGAGIALVQLQFSTLRGSGSATRGAGMAIEGGYSFSNTVQSIDLEASPRCLLLTSIKASNNFFTAPYVNCPVGVASSHASAQIANGFDPTIGGDVRLVWEWLD